MSAAVRQRWEKGADQIEKLLDEGKLMTVAPNRFHAEALLDESQRHLDAAKQIAPLDPTGAYVLAYDAVRKALAACLARQGLRGTRDGGHVIFGEAFEAQTGQTHLVNSFHRFRRRRNETEYPTENDPLIQESELAELLEWSDTAVPQIAQFAQQPKLGAF